MYVAVTYGYLYLLFTTITDVYENVYHFSTGLAGLSYIGIGVGMLIGLAGFGVTSDRRIKNLSAKGKETPPEIRLEVLFPAAICVPIGLFWYGWSVEKQIHWIMPIIGTAWFGLGLIGIFVSGPLTVIFEGRRIANSCSSDGRSNIPHRLLHPLRCICLCCRSGSPIISRCSRSTCRATIV